MSDELTFENLQKLKDQKKQCEDNLKGEGNIIKAEEQLKVIDTKIESAEIEMAKLIQTKIPVAVVASGRPGLENSKLILKDLAVRIPELEKVLKAQTS